MFDWCRRTAERPWFHNFILFVIIVNAVLVGLETSRDLSARHEQVFDAVNHAVQAIFVAEILIRFLACHPRYLNFFRNGWNIFDLTVVVLSFVPAIGPFATVARLARVLRVTRLVEYSSELRLIVDTMLRSIPSMGHVVLMLGLLIYVYAVLGVNLFRGEVEITPGVPDPRWDNIGAAAWAMFHTITFENWVALQAPVMEKFWWGWLFFFSFIIIGVFVGINLFVAVVMNNLEEVKEEHAKERMVPENYREVLDRVHALKAQLEDLEMSLQKMSAGEKKNAG